MADMEPTTEERERILQALIKANSHEEVTLENDDQQEKSTRKKNQRGNANETWAPEKDGGRSIQQIVCDCIHINETVLENKLVYFMLSAGSTGATPYLFMYSMQWGLSSWSSALAIGIGLLVAFVLTPLWGLVADKLRWHRGMFWTVILLWMGFTIAAVYAPQPDQAPCDEVTSRISDLMSKDCYDENPTLEILGEQRKVSMDYLRHYPISMQTWPEAYIVDVMQVCASYNNQTYWVGPEKETLEEVTMEQPLPPSNMTDNPQEADIWQPLNSNSSLTTDVPSGKRLIWNTSLGRLFSKVLLEQTSLIVFILATAAGVFQIVTFSMADAATLMSLGEAQRDRYGWQRSFGTMGFAMSSYFVAIMLTKTRTTMSDCGITWEQTDYFVGIVVFAGFMIIGVLVSSWLRFEHNDMSSKHSIGQVLEVIVSRNYSSIFVAAFVLSFCNGGLSTFLHWHLHKLGVTATYLGAGITLHVLADIITSYCTAWIIKKAGYHYPLIMGIVGYCVVYLAYALVCRPGWIVIIQIIHGSSFAITLNTMTSYLSSSVALVSQASVQGLLSGVYWGLGPAVGTILFGYLVDVIGSTLSFYTLTLVSMVYGLIFVIWNRHELPMINKHLPGDYKPVNAYDAD